MKPGQIGRTIREVAGDVRRKISKLVGDRGNARSLTSAQMLNMQQAVSRRARYQDRQDFPLDAEKIGHDTNKRIINNM
jgi:hypothetical protein